MILVVIKIDEIFLDRKIMQVASEGRIESLQRFGFCLEKYVLDCLNFLTK